MNPKPLASLNHLTVPMAIASSRPASEKRNSQPRLSGVSSRCSAARRVRLDKVWAKTDAGLPGGTNRTKAPSAPGTDVLDRAALEARFLPRRMPEAESIESFHAFESVEASITARPDGAGAGRGGGCRRRGAADAEDGATPHVSGRHAQRR